MSLSSILALADARHGAATLTVAGLASDKLGAPVDVLIAKIDPRRAIPMVGEGLSGELVQQIMDSAAADAEVDAAACQAHVAAWSGHSAANVIEQVGARADLIAQNGRTYGMTVLPCPSGSGEDAFEGIVDAALFDTGRPTLIAPLQQVKSVGNRIAIFWNDSAQSARAVWGATPFLAKAETINIYGVDESFEAEPALARITAGLARIGVTATPHVLTGNGSPQNQLIDAAAGMDADLVIMGAFTHSRLRELVLGGVTKHMLEVLARPTFMAH